VSLATLLTIAFTSAKPEISVSIRLVVASTPSSIRFVI